MNGLLMFFQMGVDYKLHCSGLTLQKKVHGMTLKFDWIQFHLHFIQPAVTKNCYRPWLTN